MTGPFVQGENGINNTFARMGVSMGGGREVKDVGKCEDIARDAC